MAGKGAPWVGISDKNVPLGWILCKIEQKVITLSPPPPLGLDTIQNRTEGHYTIPPWGGYYAK